MSAQVIAFVKGAGKRTSGNKPTFEEFYAIVQQYPLEARRLLLAALLSVTSDPKPFGEARARFVRFFVAAGARYPNIEADRMLLVFRPPKPQRKPPALPGPRHIPMR